MEVQKVYVKRGTSTEEPWLSVTEQHTNHLVDLVVETEGVLLTKEDAKKIKETMSEAVIAMFKMNLMRGKNIQLAEYTTAYNHLQEALQILNK